MSRKTFATTSSQRVASSRTDSKIGSAQKSICPFPEFLLAVASAYCTAMPNQSHCNFPNPAFFPVNATPPVLCNYSSVTNNSHTGGPTLSSTAYVITLAVSLNSRSPSGLHIWWAGIRFIRTFTTTRCTRLHEWLQHQYDQCDKGYQSSYAVF
jgi:hypothetical protein